MEKFVTRLKRMSDPRQCVFVLGSLNWRTDALEFYDKIIGYREFHISILEITLSFEVFVPKFVVWAIFAQAQVSLGSVRSWEYIFGIQKQVLKLFRSRNNETQLIVDFTSCISTNLLFAIVSVVP